MKKQFLSVLMFASVFSMNSFINADAPVAPLVDNSGKDRINYIMSQIKYDIVPGNAQPIVYVQASNLNQDLNIPAIAESFGCKTVMGNVFLRETLQRPVSPTDQSGIVGFRMNAIMQLVNNPELKKQVEEILEDAAEQEIIAMELMSNTFKGQTCPEIQALQMLKEQKHPLYGFINFMNTNFIAKAYGTVSNIFFTPCLWAGTVSIGYLATLNDYERYEAGLFMSSADCAIYSAYTGLLAAVITYAVYDDLTKSGQKRVKMRALNKLIHAAESIEELCNESNLATQFKMSLITNSAGVALVEGLKYTRYENEADYCFNVPAVHTFLYEVYQNEDQLAQVFASIAEMDAYNAIATKMLEGQGTDHEFCFAQVMTSAQPQVVSTGFWNVLVPGAVINSMKMNQHVILTGPNAGGKTTSIRAILQNIVFAQTYGIAAAEQFAYTQFDALLSYLNISDDLINGYSLFASEVKRAKELLEIIKALQPTQKLFFALDELFTGTASEQGEKCAYEFIKKTATFDGTLFIYATHFDKLKDLGKQNIGLMNCKVDAPIKNNDGKLVYPYTLSAGASTVNVAEDMAKEAGLFE